MCACVGVQSMYLQYCVVGGRESSRPVRHIRAVWGMNESLVTSSELNGVRTNSMAFQRRRSVLFQERKKLARNTKKMRTAQKQNHCYSLIVLVPVVALILHSQASLDIYYP